MKHICVTKFRTTGKGKRVMVALALNKEQGEHLGERYDTLKRSTDERNFNVWCRIASGFCD